jgi:hypothetical protein
LTGSPFDVARDGDSNFKSGVCWWIISLAKSEIVTKTGVRVIGCCVFPFVYIDNHKELNSGRKCPKSTEQATAFY